MAAQQAGHLELEQGFTGCISPKTLLPDGILALCAAVHPQAVPSHKQPPAQGAHPIANTFQQSSLGGPL